MTPSSSTSGRRLWSAALIAAVAAALVPAALIAHGEGVLELASSSAAAGGELVVHGSGFPTGEDESYRLVLVGALEERELESVRPDEEGEFSITLTVPDDLDEGRYRLAAVAPDGDVVDRADLAVLQGSAEAGGDAEDTSDREARADDLPLERRRSGAEWGVVVLLVGLAGGLGARLLRG